MKSILLILLFVFYLVSAKSQSDGKSSALDTAEKPHNAKRVIHQPLYFVDSILITPAELDKFNPSDIAAIDVYKDSSAFKLVGYRGENGLIYIETKKFARKKYWSFFASKSDAYLKWVPNAESDSAVVYILNNKVLKTSFENELSKIDDLTFVSLIVVDAEVLKRDYNVTDKKGIIYLDFTHFYNSF